MWGDLKKNIGYFMKRVAFVATGYIKRYDGVSVYTENLLHTLLSHKSIHQKEIEVDIYTGESVSNLLKKRVSIKELDDIDNINFIEVNDKNFYLKTLDLTKKLFKHGKYDLIFMTNLMPIIFSPGKRVKVIHDFSKRRFPKLYTKFGLIYNLFLIHGAKMLDYGIGYISKTTESDLKKYLGVDKGNKKLLFVPNGIPLKVKNFKRPTKNDMITKYQTRDLKMCVVGRINRHKGFDRLLKFCLHFDQNRDFDSIKLYIVGKQTKETEEIFKDQNFQNIEIIFCGFLDDESLNEIYKKSHFSFFLSRNEGYGLPLLEAMWFRSIPIISKIDIFDEIMGEEFTKFDDISGYEESIESFILSMFYDKDRVLDTIKSMERVIEKELQGYTTSADNLVKFIKNI